MNDRTINIRNIQHFLYCPRRYALLELNSDWAENAFVVKADILHQHVHDGSHSFSDSKKIVRSNIAIYNDLPQYDLYGMTDCVEFVRSSQGVSIPGCSGKYAVRLVEYKPKAPKDGGFRETDAIQVFAQKVCADFVWHWFLITGYAVFNEVMMVKLVSYGEYIWADFGRLWNLSSGRKGGMIRIEKHG